MRISIIGMMIILMIACQPNENNQQSNSDTMDSITAVVDKPGKKDRPNIKIIDGPAGKLLVDDSGEGPAILFAHSFGGSSVHWNQQLATFRKDHRVIAFDFRGHGQSSSPSNAESFSAEQLAEDIQAVVDGLKLESVILVGHSMGGIAAIQYAATHPEKVRGLVLAGTPGKTPAEQAKPIVASLKSDQYQSVMDQYMKRLLENATFRTDSLLNSGVAKIDKTTSISIVSSMFAFDPTSKLKDLKTPTLIIATSAEEKQPNTLHKLVPEIPAKIIDGTSHWTMIDKPTEFNNLLEEFIKSIQ